MEEKQKTESKFICQNSYRWGLAKPEYWAEPVLHQPKPGELDVPDLVKPGDWIKSSYNTCGMVISILRQKHDIGGRHVHSYSISFWAPHQLNGTGIPREPSWYNDVVAEDGKLVSLFDGDRWTDGQLVTYQVLPLPDIALSPAVKRYLEKKKQEQQLKLF